MVPGQLGSNHVGMLVHGLFNASIAADQLPTGSSFDSESEKWVIGGAETKERSEIGIGSTLPFKVAT